MILLYSNMNEKFEEWKNNLEDKASEIVEAPKEEINQAVRAAAGDMKDLDYLKRDERPLDEIIKELEPEGWQYRGLVSGGTVYEAVEKDKREIMILGTGTNKYIFERDKKSQ